MSDLSAQPQTAQTTNAEPASSPSTDSVSSGSQGSSTPSSTTSATTKKIVLGGAPRTKEKADQTTQQAASDDLDDDTFWGKYGERIFKHKRFQELNGYKKQYEEVLPVVQWAKQFEPNGGLRYAEDLHTLFGPIAQQLQKKDPATQQKVWQKLLPALQAVLSDQDFSVVLSNVQQAQMDSYLEDDPDAPFVERHLQPVQSKLQTLEQQIHELTADRQQRQQAEVEGRRKANYDKYGALFEKKMSDKDNPIPESLKNMVADLVVRHLPTYMPVNPRTGATENPLDVYSEEAFNNMWEEKISTAIANMESAVKSKLLSTKQVMPDANSSKLSKANAPMLTQDQRIAKFAASLKRMVSG